MKFHFSSYISLSIAILVSLSASLSSAEGNKVGNGGNTIVCEKEKKLPSIQLLDFYEDKIDFKTPQMNPYAIAETVFINLKKSAPKLSDLYLKRLKEIPNEIEFKSEVAFKQINDSEHLFVPLEKNCKVLQTAIRKANINKDEKRFLFRKDLWEQMSPLDRAGLLTHEIIYEHLSKLGEENSIKARKMNRLIYKNSLTANEFWNFIKEIELPIYP